MGGNFAIVDWQFNAARDVHVFAEVLNPHVLHLPGVNVLIDVGGFSSEIGFFALGYPGVSDSIQSRARFARPWRSRMGYVAIARLAAKRIARPL